MSQLQAAFGSSHSVMLAATLDDWISAFCESDRRMPLFDRTGAPCKYDELLESAPQNADAMVTPEKITTAFRQTFAAIAELKDYIESARLDALIIIGDDQHELFMDAMMPSLAIYYGGTIRNAARVTPPGADWYRRAQLERLEPEQDAHYPVQCDLALHLITGLTKAGFEPCALRELRAEQYEGHAYSYIHRTYLDRHPVPVVPVMLNTYYPPNQMTPKRCVELGGRLHDVIQSFPSPMRIGMLASGGLSHFVVDEALDRGVIEALGTNDLDHLGSIDPKHLQAGSSEIRSWIVTGAAAAAAGLKLDWTRYIPGYRTPALTGTGLGFARWS